MDNNEAYNNRNAVYLSYDPNSFPYLPVVSALGIKAEHALRD